MYLIALSLGFFGSLHCLGMCGPLSMAYFSSRGTRMTMIWSALSYQLGRLAAYMTLGVGMGLLGSLAVWGGVQKVLIIVMGATFIAMFLFSVHPDRFQQFPGMHSVYRFVTNWLSYLLSKAGNIPAGLFGFVNGLLPCGLVYLGIAGALSTGTMWGSMGFMLFFGLGTVPAMLLVLPGISYLTPTVRGQFRRLYPVAMGVLGLYMMYRGLFSVRPLELDFWEALQHPVMCHGK